MINGKIEESIPTLENLIEQNPNDYAAHFNLAGIYSKQKKHDKVFDHIKALYRIRPSLEMGIRLFMAFMNKRGLFRIFAIFIYLLGIVALIFKLPILIALFIMIVGSLIFAGVYLKVKDRQK